MVVKSISGLTKSIPLGIVLSFYIFSCLNICNDVMNEWKFKKRAHQISC